MSSTALLLVGTVATIAANLSIMTMIDEMNVALPPKKKISVLGFWPGKTVYIFTAYPEVCPSGMANRRAVRRMAAFLVSWLVFALFFFGVAGFA